MYALGHAGSPIGGGAFPAVYIATGNDARLLAHELGHYFGLAHPHAGFIPGQTLASDEDCYNTGDGICDTPIDPQCTHNMTTCEATCSPATDPLGMPYRPLTNNLMSYYGDCRNQFTTNQRTRMSTLYQFSPNFAFLRVVTSCLRTSYGVIERNCNGMLSDPNAVSIRKMENLRVDMRNSFNSNNNPICTTTTNLLGRYFYHQCSNSTAIRAVYPNADHGHPLDGISVLDIAMISQHILNIRPLVSPFQKLAADANRSGTITTLDGVALRRLILGIDEFIPGNTNWHYISKDYFNDPLFNSPLSENGMFNAVWYSENGEPLIMQDRVIAEFDIEPLQNITNLTEHFVISDEHIPTLFYDTTGQIIEDVVLYLSISDTIPGTGDRSKIWKDKGTIRVVSNVVNDLVHIIFEGQEGQEATVRIFNATGREILSWNGPITEPYQEVLLQEVGNLTSGLYLYHVQTATDKNTGKLLKP